MHVRTGDAVKVIAGNYKNKTGKIILVDPANQRAVVEGLNLQTHYNKPTQKDPKGSLTKKEGPIHVSNLMLIDPSTKKPTRIGRKKNDKGKLQRYAKKTGKLL